MKPILYLIIAFLVIIIFVGMLGMYKFNYLSNVPGYDVDGNPVAKVVLKDDVIYFKGKINQQSYELLLAKIAAYKDVVFSKIIIKSEGGDTIYGRKIADFIIDKQLDVEVEEICFSSCANYIFPAGKIKYIQKHAFVGWHGSEFQGLLLKETGQTFEEYQKEILTKALLEIGIADEDIFNREYQKLMSSVLQEWHFSNKVSISTALPLLGIDKLSDDSPYMGWVYSIEDMNKLGINNTVYFGQESEYPLFQDTYNKKLFRQIYDHKRVIEIEQLISKYIKSVNTNPYISIQ